MRKDLLNLAQTIWKATILLGLLALALGLAWPVLADYLGPDRTVTTWIWERSTCTYLATKAGGTCSLTLYYPPHSCVAAAFTAGFFNNSPTACGVGWGGTCGVNFPCSISQTGDSVGVCSSGENGCTSTSHTVTHPEATVSGTISCAQTGNAGWCVGSANLALSASEPLSGYSITIIEGTRNGETFACPGTACTVPLLEGQNDFTYWALSTWGDSSQMGSASGKLDSQPPQVGLSGAGSFCPACGESLSVSLNVSDATSGVASWALTLDSASLASGSAAASQTVPVPSGGLAAGSHSLTLSAVDVAGNTNSTTLTFTLLLPTPTPTFTPIPTATAVPALPGNPPVGNPTSQGGSSIPVMLATPTSISATPTPKRTTQSVSRLPTLPAAYHIPESGTPGGEPTTSTTPVLWGSAALALIGSATAYTLSKRHNKTSQTNANAYLKLASGLLAIVASIGGGMLIGEYAYRGDKAAPLESNPSTYSNLTSGAYHHLPCSDVYEEFCQRNILVDQEGVERMLKYYGVSLTEVGNGTWTLDTTEAVYFAANDMGSVFAEEIGVSPRQAFRDVYGLHDGRQFTFEWDAHCLQCRSAKMMELCVDEEQKPVFSGTRTFIDEYGETITISCKPQGGYTHLENYIEFATLWPARPAWRTFGVVHELSHAFALRWYDTDENGASVYARDGPYVSIPEDLYEDNEGFYQPDPRNNPTFYPWRQHPCNPPKGDPCTPNETFADMGLAYIYGNKFADNDVGRDRADLMAKNMPGWIRAAVDR